MAESSQLGCGGALGTSCFAEQETEAQRGQPASGLKAGKGEPAPELNQLS